MFYADIVNVRNILKNETWFDVFKVNDINVAVSIFLAKIDAAIKISKKKIRYNISKSKVKFKKWISQVIIMSILHRDKRLKKNSHLI